MLRFLLSSPCRAVRSRPFSLRCKLPLSFGARTVHIYLPSGDSPRGGQGRGLKTNNLRFSPGVSRFSTTTLQDSGAASPDVTVLSQDQRDEIFSGRFPTDFSGEVIKIRTTHAEYHKLFDTFNEIPSKMKRSVILEFNENISTTVIRERETPIHESLIRPISHQIQNLMSPSPELFALWGNTQIATTLADPDLQLLWKTNTGTFPFFAVEVGFSQASGDLETKVKELLQKSTVRVAVMIDVKEKPIYKNPFRKQKGIDLYKAERDSQPASFETLLQLSCEDRPLFSPVSMYGLRWTGEFSASVQVFAKDPATGEPLEKTERITFFGPPKPQKEKSGRKEEGEGFEQKPIHEESPNLNVKLSDFVPLSDDIYKQDLILKWDVLRSHLGVARKLLARERYLAAIEKLEKDGRI